MLKNYKNTHRWLIIPFVVILLGFAPSYWLKLGDAPFRQHLHGLTATLWFIVLMMQPYLVTHGKARQHRLYGMFALFVAGGVAFSAAGTIPYNFLGSLPDTGKYGLSFIDVIVVTGFSVAVLMAMRHAKNIDDHAKWMISTVFWAVMPGLFRLIFIAFAVTTQGNIPEWVTFPGVLATCGALNIAILAYLMYRDRQAHPAYLSVAAGSLAFFLPTTVYQWQWWRSLADTVFTV
jgi:hypothetical protein